jgi:hypothetical protein
VSHRDFANIAVGDTVIINNSRGRTLHKVTKVTRTQFAIESGTRFMRSDGGEYGGDQWHREWVTIPNANDIAAVKAEQRQQLAVDAARRLRNQIDTALLKITRSRAQGRGPTIEASNDHLRRALDVLQAEQEELP